MLAAIVPVRATGTPGLISPDTNNFAPRIGLAYQATNKLVIRTGYGIFYGGGEAGAESYPSAGVKTPLFFRKKHKKAVRPTAANPRHGDASVFPPYKTSVRRSAPSLRS